MHDHDEASYVAPGFNPDYHDCAICLDSGISHQDESYCTCRMGPRIKQIDEFGVALKGYPFKEAVRIVFTSTMRTEKALAAADKALLMERIRKLERELAEAKAAVPAWINVKDQLPQVEELVMVYSPPTKYDHPGEINITFDCIDPNDDDHASWLNHNEHYEHFCCVAKSDECPMIGPSEEAPYTHWMPIPGKPIAVAEQTKQQELK